MAASRPEIIILERKDGKFARVRASNISTYNVDEDGTGSLVILSNGVLRPVVETPRQIDRLLGCGFKLKGEEEK
jgi:hypothetical protein